MRAIEEMVFDLLDDDDFWEVQANSLAVFATPGSLRTFRLANRLQSVVEVSDRFYVKPLLRGSPYLNPQWFWLWPRTVCAVEVTAGMPAMAVKVEGLPVDAASAVGKSSIQDRSPSGRIQGSEGQKVRLAQYARKIDQALRGLLSGSEVPLILAATEPLLSIYRQVNTYPHLAGSAIRTNPEGTSDADLAAAARGVLDELFQQELKRLHDLYAERANQGRATGDVAQAARAATFGAVEQLLVDIDQQVPGTIDDTGAVTCAKDPCPASYGVVDEIAGLRTADRGPSPGGASCGHSGRWRPGRHSAVRDLIRFDPQTRIGRQAPGNQGSGLFDLFFGHRSDSLTATWTHG